MELEFIPDSDLPNYYMQCLKKAKTTDEKKFWASGIRSLCGFDIVTESNILINSQSETQELVTAYMQGHSEEPFLMLELRAMLLNKGHWVSHYRLRLELAELVSMKFIKSFRSKRKSKSARPVKHYQWIRKPSRVKLSV